MLPAPECAGDSRRSGVIGPATTLATGVALAGLTPGADLGRDKRTDLCLDEPAVWGLAPMRTRDRPSGGRSMCAKRLGGAR